MIFWKIFRYEFAHLAASTSTRLYLLVLFAFTIVMKLLITTGDGVFPNNTFHITAMTVIGSLIWLVMGASVAGKAAARDVQVRIQALVYTAPVTKLSYLGGKFCAAFSVNALLALALPAGILLSFHLPGMEPQELLPFRLMAYLNVYFLIALPAVFAATALQFCLAALSGKVMAAYGASLLLALVAQVIAMAAAKLFGNWDLVKLLDPVGVAGIIGSELSTWTATEKNTRLVAFEEVFFWNRVLWLSFAVGMLRFTYIRFSFTDPVSRSWWSRFKRRPQAQVKAAPGRVQAITVPQVRRSFGYRTHFLQLLSIACWSFRKIARSPMGLTVVGAVALGSAVFADQVMLELGIPLLPNTAQILSYLSVPIGNIASPLAVVPLLTLYFAGHLLWHERDAGLSDVADAAPVTDWVLFTGKLLGLGLIIVVWMAQLLTGGILMQLRLGYAHADIGLYVQVLFGLQLVNYLLFALLVFTVQAAVNNKHIGYLAVFLIFSFMAFPSYFGVEHNMLIFGADPGWVYTDMRGFGNSIVPWLWFKAYWIAWALLLATGASLLWARGRETGLKYRLSGAKRRFSGSTRRFALLALGLVLLTGSFIFYNTNVLNVYQGSTALSNSKAGYERRYGKYRNMLQPQITATKLYVELYPTQQRAEIRAVYTLLNTHSKPISTVHMSGAAGVSFAEVRLNRAAAAIVNDQKLGYAIYSLKKALQPGDSLKLNFTVRYQQRGFSNYGASKLLVKNGSAFTNYDLLPAIGYQRYREIKDAASRKEYKLAARPAVASLYDAEARKKPAITDQNAFEAIIGTEAGEIALAPGALQRTWEKGGRRYFHYKTGAAIGNEHSILSGKYAVRESQWKDVAIRVYYYPGHAHSLNRTLRSVKASLGYFTEQFGAYPYKHLTVAEAPGAGGGASSDASMITYGEQYSLMRPDDGPDGFDLPYYILAHEVAHQWWGLARLRPANVEGAGLLIEGLAVYSGMQVLEKAYGDAHLRKYVDYLHASYEMPRSLATVPLLRANETFLYYRKGGLAMYALSKYLGKESVNAALRRLLQKHSSGALPLPTSADLYAGLDQVTPDSLKYLLHDLFKENMYWRLKTRRFTAAQTKAGNWQVQLELQAQKVVVDSTGAEREAPMNDWLEVGVYEKGKDQPMYLRMHRIRSGIQTLTLTVPRKPESGGIDPNWLMIDLRRDDNVRKAEISSVLK